MDDIREQTKKYLSNKKKTYNYVRELDHAMKNYLTGFIKIVFIWYYDSIIVIKCKSNRKSFNDKRW